MRIINWLQMKYINKLKFFQKQSKNDVFKNMAILAMGVGGAQVISLALTPVLTRIYTPEDFGILAIFMAVVGIVSPFSTLRYSVPIPLLKKDGIAINLFALTTCILLFLTTLVIFILSFYVDEIFEIFSIGNLVSYWWLIPIMIFVSGSYEILNAWSIRQKYFKAISKSNVFKTLSSSLVKIFLGVLEVKPMGLLVGAIFANIYGTVFLAKSNFQSIKGNIRYITKKRIVFLAQRYVEYPKYRLPSQFILVLSQQAPLLFLATFFGANVVGYFGLTMMVLSVPLALFGSTTGQAYYAEIAKIGRKDPIKIYEVTQDVIKKLFLLSLVPFLILFFFSPALFNMIFGENWNESGEYASMMSFYMLTAFISSPLANVLSVFEHQLMFLKLNIIRLIVIGITFFMCWFLHCSASETIALYSFTMSMYYIYLSFYIMKTIQKYTKKGDSLFEK